jgi:hypothetical protein
MTNLFQEVSLVPFDLTQKQEAQMIVDIVLKYYSGSAYPPSVEKVMKGDVLYYKAYFQNKLVGMSGFFYKIFYKLVLSISSYIIP